MTWLWSTISETTAVIAQAKLGLVAAAFAVDTLALFVMAFRWRLLLHSLRSRASYWETLLAYSAGVCVCNITPARALGGDACRAALIPRPGGSPSMKAIGASVVYDRVSDVAGFLMLGALALPTLRPQSPRWVLLAVLALAAALAARPLYRRISSRIGQWHHPVVGNDMRASLAAAAGCSLVIWLLDITRIILVAAAFGVRFVPSQAASVSLLRLGSGVVPVPAGIGVVDGALVAGFVWLGLPAATAAAMAIVERAIVYLWSTVLGATALLLLGGWRALRQARTATAAASSSEIAS
ncbi:MAG TPA: lysylphosphatidylglycerol synthase transmembrane domain-containing protein [Vicinamibacterales bacterium]|jgi:hypothetical protein